MVQKFRRKKAYTLKVSKLKSVIIEMLLSREVFLLANGERGALYIVGLA